MRWKRWIWKTNSKLKVDSEYAVTEIHARENKFMMHL